MALIEQWNCDSGSKLWLFEIPSTSQMYEETGKNYTQRELEAMVVQEVIAQNYTNQQLSKDEFGKPYLSPKQTEINYSHTKDFLFWGENVAHQIGVDIETLRPQLAKIKGKFCREDEFEFIPTDNELPYLLAIWSAKESIYKAFGKKEVDFREHMQILPFELTSTGSLHANFLLHKPQKYEVYYKWEGSYFMSWTLKKD